MSIKSTASTLIGLSLCAAAFAAGEPLPGWAYPWAPEVPAPKDDGIPRQAPGSNATYTPSQIDDLFAAVVWHPADHAPPPGVVALGRKPDLRACGSCHRSDGAGGPENANLAGLPAAYIVQQLKDYQSGARKFAGPGRAPSMLMVSTAKAMTDEDMRIAADYFSAQKPRANYTVIEASTVPKSFVNRNFAQRLPGDETEPLGQRIVDMPKDAEQFKLRDPRTQFVAYVAPGSIARGESLVKTGGGGITAACATCHGADLKGLGSIPGIAGRSPSYVVRQLYDFQQGARAGAMSALMKPTVEKLSGNDMAAIAAYLATQQP